ncbi:MAG: site-specific DNA-methyltransferase [Bacteroidetes bacterium]|nr:site-specific DNA-methyltransferase [Bacteroidota bacterium]MBK7589114.1 site-specific DNA-methyltransferase [Bacteroidota bacterium]MBK8330006.1 site-specific DNA-methyltransferase [Bacteroidota bacterium]MBK9301483.1 site-specific DNA-methyltransferase [Bacteroidota bacterium]HQW45669.1 site-specific DNA-methyltransferase [Chitinophagaceae bacterium]
MKRNVIKKRGVKKLGLSWELEPLQNELFYVEEQTAKNIQTKIKTATHLLFEGENYFSLQHLLLDYTEKINLIYIDPPYNTGFKQDQEGFFYHDKRSEKHHKYKHSAWLNFMFHRLVIAKKLLASDAFMFISIDENEFAQLKLLCDEIFGEDNFIHYLIWKKRSTGGQVKDGSIISQTEFILIYAKNKKYAKLNKVCNPKAGNEKWRDFRKSGGQWQQRYRPKQHFPFYYDEVTAELTLKRINDQQIEIIPQNAQGEPGFWENGLETTAKRLNNNELKIFLNPKTKKYKILQLEMASEYQNAGNFIDIPSVNGSVEIKMFDLAFNNVKPLSLIKYILALASGENSIVLDFFAGSGSTAQAVIEWNTENNYQQTCIVCTNNEYNLCEEVTYPRLKRVIKGYVNSQKKKYSGHKQNLKYFKVS